MSERGRPTVVVQSLNFLIGIFPVVESHVELAPISIILVVLCGPAHEFRRVWVSLG